MAGDEEAVPRSRRPVAARLRLSGDCELRLESIVPVANGCCLLFGVDGRVDELDRWTISLRTHAATVDAERVDVSPGLVLPLGRAAFRTWVPLRAATVELWTADEQRLVVDLGGRPAPGAVVLPEVDLSCPSGAHRLRSDGPVVRVAAVPLDVPTGELAEAVVRHLGSGCGCEALPGEPLSAALELEDPERTGRRSSRFPELVEQHPGLRILDGLAPDVRRRVLLGLLRRAPAAALDAWQLHRAAELVGAAAALDPSPEADLLLDEVVRRIDEFDGLPEGALGTPWHGARVPLATRVSLTELGAGATLLVESVTGAATGLRIQCATTGDRAADLYAVAHPQTSQAAASRWSSGCSTVGVGSFGTVFDIDVPGVVDEAQPLSLQWRFHDGHVVELPIW